MAWLWLLAAGVFEVTWAVAMKYSEGLTRLWPTVITLTASVISFFLLAQAVRTLSVGTGYAVLNGLGIAGTVIFGILFLADSIQPFRLVCVALILFGIVGLRISDPPLPERSATSPPSESLSPYQSSEVTSDRAGS